jgi:hypothetical protein
MPTRWRGEGEPAKEASSLVRSQRGKRGHPWHWEKNVEEKGVVVARRRKRKRGGLRVKRKKRRRERRS